MSRTKSANHEAIIDMCDGNPYDFPSAGVRLTASVKNLRWQAFGCAHVFSEAKELSDENRAELMKVKSYIDDILTGNTDHLDMASNAGDK
jgi:hypothetical protein